MDTALTMEIPRLSIQLLDPSKITLLNQLCTRRTRDLKFMPLVIQYLLQLLHIRDLCSHQFIHLSLHNPEKKIQGMEELLKATEFDVAKTSKEL